MVGIGAIEFHHGLEGHAVGKSTFETLFDGISWRVNEIVEELEHEIVSRVGDGEVLREHLVESVVLSQFGRGVEL